MQGQRYLKYWPYFVLIFCVTDLEDCDIDEEMPLVTAVKPSPRRGVASSGSTGVPSLSASIPRESLESRARGTFSTASSGNSSASGYQPTVRARCETAQSSDMCNVFGRQSTVVRAT